MKPIITYHVRFIYDDDAVFEECNGEQRPLTAEEYVGNEYQKNGQNVSYEDYLAYYGNPDRHVYLGCIAERRETCPCCEETRVVNEASIWGIDYMDDAPELDDLKIGHNYDYTNVPDSLKMIAGEVLEEAGWQPPKHIYCATEGCGFWHMNEGPDQMHCAQHQTPSVLQQNGPKPSPSNRT